MYPNSDLSFDRGDPFEMDAVLFEDGVSNVAKQVRSILERDPPELAIIEGSTFDHLKGYFPRPYDARRLCMLSMVCCILLNTDVAVELVDWKEEGSVYGYRSRARNMYIFDNVPNSNYELEAVAIGLGYMAGQMEVIERRKHF